MKVLYILNDNQFYMRCAWLSMNSLRYFNPDIPIDCLIIKDGGRDSRDTSYLLETDMGCNIETQEQFANEACHRFNANVIWVDDYDSGDELKFPPAQRQEFRRIDGDSVLFLDADTFVLDDISSLFDKKSDVTAGKTNWIDVSLVADNPSLCDVRTFNSGVVLYRNGMHREYGEKLHALLKYVKDEITPEGIWLSKMEYLWEVGAAEVGGQHTIKKQGREEFAFCCWAHEKSNEYFQPYELQTCNYYQHPKIMHTMTPHYFTYHKMFYKGNKFKPPKRIKKSLLLK